MIVPDFWDDQEAAQKVINESNALKDIVGDYNELERSTRKS